MTFCPRCGYNITVDRIVTIGDWTIDPRGAVTYRGRTVPTTPMQTIIMHTIAADAPRFIKRAALFERIGSESDHHDIISTMIWRLKQLCVGQGVPFPIIARQRFGYRWVD